MKIFSWVVNKINGRQEASRLRANPCATHRANMSDCRNDEFSDWPQSLLAIGTLGSKEFKEADESMQEASNAAEEELDKIRKELEMLMASSEQPSSNGPNEKCREQVIENKMITTKARDLLASSHGALKPRSVAAVLKMMFACKGGFSSSIPELRNSFPQSRMEKFLKAVLQKKIHPQNSTSTVTTRYLDRTRDEKEIKECIEDAMKDMGDDRAKWVKTDSEYIVLEM